MRLLLALACLLSCMQLVHSFTVGILLPDYICHPDEGQPVSAILPTGNLPKSLATYLPFVVRMSNSPLDAYAIDQPNIALGVSNTQHILSNWHNRNITSPGCSFVFQTNTSVTINGITYTNQIVPGQVHTLTLQIRAHDFIAPANPAAGEATCDVPISSVTTADINGLALDGAIIYAVDSTLHRVGAMNPLATGTLQFNPACGPWGIGVVHNQLVSGTGLYPMDPATPLLYWTAPGYLTVGTSLTFQGAGVSDAGFGKHSTVWPVVALPATGINLPVASPVITFATWIGANLMVFFDPMTMAGVNTQLIAASYTVTVTNSAGTNTISGTAVAASPASISYLALAGAGLTGNVLITITANPVTGSQTAAQVASISLAYPTAIPASAPSAAITLTQAAAVCNATYMYQTAFFNMYQNDNQCSYQTTLFASGTVTAATVKASAATPIASVSVAHTFIAVIAVVAAVFSFTKRD